MALLGLNLVKYKKLLCKDFDVLFIIMLVTINYVSVLRNLSYSPFSSAKYIFVNFFLLKKLKIGRLCFTFIQL